MAEQASHTQAMISTLLGLIAALSWTQIGEWEVGQGFGDHSTCTMVRSFNAGQAEVHFGVTFSPLKRIISVTAGRSDWGSFEGERRVTFAFSPSEIDFISTAKVLNTDGDRSLYFEIDDLLALRLLAQSKFALVVDEDGHSVHIPLAGSAAATNAMKDCTTDRLTNY